MGILSNPRRENTPNNVPAACATLIPQRLLFIPECKRSECVEQCQVQLVSVALLWHPCEQCECQKCKRWAGEDREEKGLKHFGVRSEAM